MNILFLTLVNISSLEERGIYQDLLLKFVREGHSVTIVTPVERRENIKTNIRFFKGYSILQVKTFNIQKTNVIEKGVGTLSIEHQYLDAIKKYLWSTRFHLVLYSTPPITFSKIISFIKKRDSASSYLLLKDIFPQNAVDIGMMKEGSILHHFFKKKENRLYELSDYIGCMSPANVKYILNHNKIAPERVEVCPNSIELSEHTITLNRQDILNKYNIPTDATLFVYGGNLGRPQGLNFLLDVLQSNKVKTDRYFLIVGSGTEYPSIKQWFEVNRPSNAQLIPSLPKTEYDNLVKAAEVGLIFLDPRFTIPNYPSRLLSYLENKMPVLMATDINTDIGIIADENGYGTWTKNGNLGEFNELVDNFCDGTFSIKRMGEAGYEFLKNNYTVDTSYGIIMKHFEYV